MDRQARNSMGESGPKVVGGALLSSASARPRKSAISLFISRGATYTIC